MPYQVGVLEALNDYGVNYVEHPGCRTRGYSSFWPGIFIEHHDAGSRYWNDSLPSIFVDGRPDLAGPLCNFATGWDGLVHVVALGAANHGGYGVWRGVSGNSKAWGNEIGNPGDNVTRYNDRQIESCVKLTAACADHSGFGAEMVCRHAEYALPAGRKPDPAGPWEDGHIWQYDMSHFRALVAQGGEDDFMATLDDKEKAALMSAVQAINGVPSFGFAPMRDLIASSQGVWIVKVKGQRVGWVTNGVQRSKVGGGLGKKLKALGVPQVEVTAAELATIPVVSG